MSNMNVEILKIGLISKEEDLKEGKSEDYCQGFDDGLNLLAYYQEELMKIYFGDIMKPADLSHYKGQPCPYWKKNSPFPITCQEEDCANCDLYQKKTT